MQPRPRRGKILYSLLLLLFLIGVLPLIATSYRLVSGMRERLEVEQKQLQYATVKSLSKEVSTLLQSVHDQVATIARTLEIGTRSGEFRQRITQMQEGRALERYVDGKTALVSISLVDQSGMGAVSGVQLAEPEIKLALEEAVVSALQTGRPRVSPPMLSTSLQEPVIVMSEPVSPGGLSVQGVVLSVVSLSPLWAAARELGETKRMEIYVVDGRGRLIAHSQPPGSNAKDEIAVLGSLSHVEIVDKLLSDKGKVGRTEPFEIKTPDGPVKMLGTYIGIPGTDWGVVAQIREDVAFHEAIAMRRESIQQVALAAILAIVFGVAFTGQITRPIRDLARSALQLAEGNYDTRVKVRSTNEVGLLGDAFNQMGAEIQKQIEQVREAAATNKELFLGSIRMLANAIDEKDPYTRGHSERVAFYSMLMAKFLGMSKEEVERVHLSGIIHDVGKIGIEDKILRKPAALTEEEYEIMKQHPRKGEHILAAVPKLKEIAGPGLQHHENWDGSGYPDGLKGEGIPLLGRIVSVADAFDAMTTDRPYSKAMTFEAALARLRQLAGKKFDPTCVEAIEKAHGAGELTPAKARLASVQSRRQSGTIDGGGEAA